MILAIIINDMMLAGNTDTVNEHEFIYFTWHQAVHYTV